ncbi:hypothetical protein TWF706_001189 [Orbilia oligospora]|nr:hypothetical protein TWF706_001189 [Orbilia oligospora]
MMFTPRQPTQTDRPTQTDIKFKKLLDASPMLKGIGQQQQQRPKKSTLTTGKNGRPTANVKVSGVGVKQGDKTKAEKGQRNRESISWAKVSSPIGPKRLLDLRVETKDTGVQRDCLIETVFRHHHISI